MPSFSPLPLQQALISERRVPHPFRVLCATDGRQQTRSGSTLRRLSIAALLLLALALPAAAQTLARPGWAGSGLNTDPWWRQAVFYQISTETPASPIDFKSIAARLDALHTLGIDALIVPMPPLPASLDSGPALDDFDELIHQASRRGIRVLVTLPAPSLPSDLAPIARFWLSRGVAGFRLVTPPESSPQDSQSLLQSLRKITNSAVGQRIVLSDFNPAATATPVPSPASRQPSRTASTRRANRSGDALNAQLQIDSEFSHLDLPEAANLRPLLARSLLTPNILLDFYHPASPPNEPDPYPALAHAISAILLTTHSAALIDASPSLALQPDATPAPEAAPQPATARTLAINHPAPIFRPAAPPAPTLADWIGKLSALHHGNATVRYGSVSVLDFDSQNALVWIIRPATNSALTPPVVVACNLSSSPQQLSLTSALHSVNLRGSFLLTLLRSDQAMGPQDLDAVALPPFAVYIGELHR
jgi:alpha-glucosidase